MGKSEPFERNAAKVADIVDSIPKGSCTTYGAIARAIGITPRYVALIMASAQEIPATPWHRVVGSDRTVRLGPQKNEQIKRLKAEGFLIDGNKIRDFSERFVTPPD